MTLVRTNFLIDQVIKASKILMRTLMAPSIKLFSVPHRTNDVLVCLRVHYPVYQNTRVVL